MYRLLLIMLASACGLAFSAPAMADETIAKAELVAEGIALYEQHCADCHKSFAKTTKPHRSIERLRSSIEYFGVMNYLEFLDDQQLDAIAAALHTIPLQKAALD